MYHNGSELLALAQEKHCPISEIVLENEAQVSGLPKSKIKENLLTHYHVMQASATKALSTELPPVGNLITGDSKRVFDYAKKGNSLCGELINLLMARALSCLEVNASMGRVCAAPTAGSCGILPAVLMTMAERLNLSDEEIVHGMLTASGIGAVITRNATVAGAEGGCQAECGAAASMAAGAVVEVAGGTPEQVFHAAAIAIKNIMGLVCDPVAGLVESPCAKRNASQAVNAVICADLALAGVKSVIPFDEVVQAMYKVGHMLPYQLRETALGGVAVTETGLKIAEALHAKKS